jgi:hypothetical protein
MRRRSCFSALAVAVYSLARAPPGFAQYDPLPAWNDGPAKQSTADFVTRMTASGGQEFVAPAEPSDENGRWST